MMYIKDPSATSSPVHVLIVEDERDCALLLQEALQQALKPACQVRHCATLSSAITTLQDYPAEVILLDLNLPDSLGLDTIRAMNSAAPEAAILVVTASGSDYLARLMLRGGAQDFLTKDEIDPATLRRAISYATERKRTENELRNSRSQIRQLEMSHSAILRATTAALASLRYDYSIVWKNEAMNQLCRTIGKPGESLEDLFENGPAFREYTRVARKRAKELQPFRTDLVLHGTDGQLISCELTLVPLDPAQTSAGYLATIIDVSDRARAENQREGLMRLTKRLAGVNTLLHLGKLLAQEAHTLFRHDAFWFSLYRDADRTVKHVYLEDTEEGETVPRQMKLDSSEIQLDYSPSFASGQPRLINRSSKEDSTANILRPFGYASRRSLSLLFAPIKWEGRVVGILSVQSYLKDRYNVSDLALIQTFADQCGVVMARLSAEDELRKQEALYRGIVQDQTELIGRVDQQGKLLFANRALSQCIWGTDEPPAGYPCLFDFVAPEERRRINLHLSMLSSASGVLELEHALLGPGGEPRRFVWTYRAITAEEAIVQYQIVGTDVTRLRLAESALARSEQRLELIVRQIPGILYTLDQDLRFTSLMGRGLHALAQNDGSEHHLIGKNLTDLLRRNQRDAIALEAHTLALEAGVTADYLLECNERQYQSRVEPLRRSDNTICGVVGVALDVTEQLNAEQEQRRLELELHEAERLAGIGRTMATIGHCMKNMLTGLNGAIFLVDRCCDSAPGENPMLMQAQDLLRRSTARITLLLLNMLDLSRERAANYSNVRVPDLIDEVLSVLRMSAAAEGVLVESVVAPEASEFQLDQDRLYRALLNLGLNALDALSAGGRLVLSARVTDGRELLDLYAAVDRFKAGAEEMIPVRAITQAGEIPKEPLLRIDVADNGSGMSAEVLEQLFQPFFSTKYSRGTGLGLAATLQFMESHNGHIFVRSRENFGTTFTLLLPTPAPAEKTTQETEEPGGELANTGHADDHFGGIA